MSRPSLDKRRLSDFRTELRERARAWIPQWNLAEGERDFGRALLDVAARLSAEVAERLDRVPEKMALGFLDWLGLRGKAAQPARMPVAFKLTDKATAPVLGRAPVRLQVAAGDATVVFETEKTLCVVPGKLAHIVAVDGSADAYYLPPPGFASLDPLLPLPTQWRLKSFAAAQATKLQLDPPLGLAPGMVVEIGSAQYAVANFENEIVAIDPPLAADAAAAGTVRKVTTFSPFDGARNQQRHALYVGDQELLNLEAPATLELVGAQTLGDATWEYWGTRGESEPGWQPLQISASTKPDALVLNKASAGAVEPRKIGEAQSRWIRAWVQRIDGCAPRLVAEELRLRINATPLVPAGAPPAIEVFVNSTPDSPARFFPLGRLPKMFDSLYLGCAEGFSKASASVAVHFDLADTVFFAAATLQASGGQEILAAVDRAGTLQLFQIFPDGSLKPLFDQGPLQPRATEGSGPEVALTSSRIRPLMWDDGTGILHVAVAGKEEVWLWRQSLAVPTINKWDNLKTPLPGNGPADESVAGLALVDDAGVPKLVALRGQKLSIRPAAAAGNWTDLPVDDGGNILDIDTIASLRADTAAPGMLVAAASDGNLYGVAPTGTAAKLRDDVAADVAPCALELAGDQYVAAVSGDGQTLRAWGSTAGSKDVAIAPDTIGGTLLDARFENGEFTVYALALDGAGVPSVLSWMPFASGMDKLVFKAPASSGTGTPAGGISLHGDRAYVPGTLGEVLSLTFTGSRLSLAAQRNRFVSAFATAPLAAALQTGDTVSAFDGAAYPLAEVSDGPTAYGPTHYYWLDAWLDVDTIGGDCEVFRTSAGASAGTTGIDANGDDQLKLIAGHTVLQDDLILVDLGLGAKQVFRARSNGNAPTVESVPPGTSLPGPAGSTAMYWMAETLQGRIAPALHLDPSNNGWDPAILSGRDVLFPDLTPRRQRAAPVEIDVPANRPLSLVFTDAWQSLPVSGSIAFVIDAKAPVWRSLIGDTSSNPDLSWEYWDGGGWAKLPVIDDTLNLKRSGDVRFDAPADFKESDWAGKKNYWIRARLVGGDYGREQIKTTSKTENGVTTQEVQTSLDGIRPPFATGVRVQYKLDRAALPAHLLTEDSGSMRDQSDANRVADAQLEIFTPLCATLGKLEEAGVVQTPPCPPECDCGSAGAVPSEAQSIPAAAKPSKTGRALYLGFDREPLGEPVNVLFSVDEERAFEPFAPLEAAALRERFEPLAAHDGTRGLGESGVVSLAIPVKPATKQLFGKSLAWVRLAPASSADAAQWQPKLRGVYLNAAWARAAETLTRELLGSSEGMPKLRLQLARPPVLEGTLELRVREPLGEEERAELVKDDAYRVLSDVENLPGHWVLWNQAPDTDDCGPTERVYMLDEATGMVRFGDGLRGAIPPIGRDCIVAFTYQRTEPPAPGMTDVPANSIAARSPLGLVSALQGVETVVSADQAAGGAPPQPAERVERFGAARLRHRDRAVTARDFEDLALERFVDVVQARCFSRSGRLRLVVVMRGAQPQPSAAFKRELGRSLLAAAATPLGAPRALRIDGPVVRRLRVAVQLKMTSLDRSGEVAVSAQQKVAALLDSACGGYDGLGWPLGAEPSADDIAAALLDLPHLQGIGEIELREVHGDGAEAAWRGAVRPAELVMLAEDGVRVAFDPAAIAA